MTSDDDPRCRCPHCDGRGVFAEKACARYGGGVNLVAEATYLSAF
jgi:hypothetical protein